MKTKLSVLGSLKIYKNGHLERDVKNLVVDTGLEWIASRLIDTGTPDQMSHLAIGTGTTAPSASDTDLETVSSPRKAFESISTLGAQVEYSANFDGATYSGAITEAGLFNALSSGIMLSRVTFSPVTISSGDALNITWTLTFANG